MDKMFASPMCRLQFRALEPTCGLARWVELSPHHTEGRGRASLGQAAVADLLSPGFSRASASGNKVEKDDVRHLIAPHM